MRWFEHIISYQTFRNTFHIQPQDHAGSYQCSCGWAWNKMCELSAGGWGSVLLCAGSDVRCRHTLLLPPSSQAHPCPVPLEVAAEEGHVQTVKGLLDGGASINHQSKVRSTCYTTSMHYIVHFVTRLRRIVAMVLYALFPTLYIHSPEHGMMLW